MVKRNRDFLIRELAACKIQRVYRTYITNKKEKIEQEYLFDILIGDLTAAVNYYNNLCPNSRILEIHITPDDDNYNIESYTTSTN